MNTNDTPVFTFASPTLLGIVSAHPMGFGFATTSLLESHFVPPSLMRELLPGDSIEFKLEAGRKPGAFQVYEPRVVARPETVWLGTLRHNRGAWAMETDEPCFAQIQIPGLTYAAEGQVVSARIPAVKSGVKPIRNQPVAAKLERVLGERTREGFDLDYAVARYDFAPHFSVAAQREAHQLAEPVINAPCPKGRLDLRATPFVTIDGESTRDFDDAVWSEQTETGWTLRVAIADVSHYVRPDMALNHEARARATSVYLPGRTFPMLPEALSNGVCSLLPEQDRYVVALQLKLNLAGEIISSEVHRAVIRSAARLTYTDVNLWRALKFDVSEVVDKSLTSMWALYQKLAELRKLRGQMDFDAPEPKVVDSESGSALEWMFRTDAHKLVEELMLLANQCVAVQLKSRAPALFRHQPQPEAEEWGQIAEWAIAHGVPLPAAPSMKALAEMRASLGPDEALKAELQARSGMRPATYESNEPSHFSLGYAAYTHFTSPIRRYADLVVHRLLLDDESSTANGLAELAAHCSKRSRDARMAERMVWDKIKKRAMFSANTSGLVLEAHVVSQSRHGLRGVVASWQASVMVSSSSLRDFGYEYDVVAEHWRDSTSFLELGSRLPVVLLGLQEEKARTEVQAALAVSIDA